ncbi:MAG: sulfatase [Phycisphaeraceae bacterium]
MNIVYLHSHDTGRYVSPYGFGVPTPHLRAFADEGVTFRQAFCAAPTCSPSRAALLTGQSAHGSGMLGLAHRGHRLRDYDQHLIHQLKPRGFHTALCGLQHIANHVGVDTIGYDEVLETQSNSVAHVAPAAEAWLADPKRKEQPFFLACGFVETHLPWPDADDEDARRVKTPDPLPDTPETRRDMARYHKSVAILDAGMGRVIAALDRAGLKDDTLVIVTTDHGIPLPEMKCNLTDHGTGVMLMMRGPGGFAGGRAIDPMVSHLDVFPTICDLLEIAPPPWLEGRSLRPLVAGEVDKLHDALFAEVTWHAGFEPKRSVRTERYLYIRRFDPKWHKPVLVNVDASESKKLWMSYGYADRPVPEEELYDNLFDPQQRNNLAEDPTHADALADGRARLDAWMKRTDDPLLTEPVPIPRKISYNPHTTDSAGSQPVWIEPGDELDYPDE